MHWWDRDGLTILGTVANGTYKTTVRPAGGSDSPAAQRTHEAIALADRIRELATAPIDQEVHGSW